MKSISHGCVTLFITTIFEMDKFSLVSCRSTCWLITHSCRLVSLVCEPTRPAKRMGNIEMRLSLREPMLGIISKLNLIIIISTLY